MLMALAASAELFHTSTGTAYADIAVAAHRETWPIRSHWFRAWLRRRYYEATADAPSPSELNDLKRTGRNKRKIVWRRADAMTQAEHAAAMADPHARPMTDEEWARAPRVPQISVIRRALKLSQEQFAATFHIPIGTVRD